MKTKEIREILKEKIKDELILLIANRLLNKLEIKIKRIKGIRTKTDKVSAGLVYMAYRKGKQQKSFGEISLMMDIPRIDVGKGYRKIKRLLGMKLCARATIMGTTCIPKTDVDGLIRNANNILKYPEEVLNNALKLRKSLEKEEGKFYPYGLVGGCIYISALQFKNNNHLKGFRITQREVADAIGITETGIRRNIFLIQDLLKLKIKHPIVYNERLKDEN